MRISGGKLNPGEKLAGNYIRKLAENCAENYKFKNLNKINKMNTQTNEWEAGAECNPGAEKGENGADCPMYQGWDWNKGWTE